MKNEKQTKRKTNDRRVDELLEDWDIHTLRHFIARFEERQRKKKNNVDYTNLVGRYVSLV